MTKKEALEFLELPETADEPVIKAKLAEKTSYFELLSEKSPSVFLRRIHEQNLAKVKLIQKELPTWSSPVVEQPVPAIKELTKTPEPVLSEPVKKETPVPEARNIITPIPEPAKAETPPVEKSRLESPQKKEELPALTDTQIVRLKPPPEPVGWLVRHTENKKVKSFPLFPGKNFIGRKIQPGIKPFVEVEDDLFVSRVHAVINVEGTSPFLFYISDTPAANGGKPSKNGTYVNGSEERVHVKTVLHEYDTVQIGETKFVLRIEMEDLLKMQEEVEDRAYMHTVVIKLRE